jgi:hypothetical protein
VHFGRSEHTNFEALRKSLKLVPKKNEVVCLISRTGSQVCFVYGYEKSNGGPVVLRSVRLRLVDRGAWNPMMLGNYAQKVGLVLDGVKLFEEYYRR